MSKSIELVYSVGIVLIISESPEMKKPQNNKKDVVKELFKIKMKCR